jgi:hypothetical protein
MRMIEVAISPLTRSSQIRKLRLRADYSQREGGFQKHIKLNKIKILFNMEEKDRDKRGIFGFGGRWVPAA